MDLFAEFLASLFVPRLDAVAYFTKYGIAVGHGGYKFGVEDVVGGFGSCSSITDAVPIVDCLRGGLRKLVIEKVFLGEGDPVV